MTVLQLIFAGWRRAGLGTKEIVIRRKAGGFAGWLPSAAKPVLLAALIVTGGIAATQAAEKPPIPTAPAAPKEMDGPGELAAFIVGRLAKLDLSKEPLTVDQAGWLKRESKKLVDLGTNALPAIKAFLKKNEDIYFDAPGSTELAGTPSLRAALMEVLGKIHNAEATAILKETFRSSGDPVELATLAKLIEQAEPGKHRAEFAAAARDTLALAAAGKLGGRDVGPLFEMLVSFGNATDAKELERYGNQWFAYVAITLLRLPEAAGVPSLIQLVQSADKQLILGRDIYLRALAEAAIQNAVAAKELQAHAKPGTLDASFWPAIGATLGGNNLYLSSRILSPSDSLATQAITQTHHISMGNQDFFEALPGETVNKEEIGNRIRLIDKLLEEMPDPAAVDALEGARIRLSERLNQGGKKSP